jgi:hypothetical protein
MTWPLTVSTGTLRCEGSSSITFEAPGGVRYAVNGTAIGQHKYPAINPIWAESTSGLGLKKNIGDLIDFGLNLCDN